MPYHAIIRYGYFRCAEFDKDRGWVERNIAVPRRNGDDILFAGKMFTWNIRDMKTEVSIGYQATWIDEIHIYHTQNHSREVYDGPDARRLDHYIYAYDNHTAEAIRTTAEEVTQQFISGPPGRKKS